jgi:Rha family phage regulatory protein
MTTQDVAALPDDINPERTPVVFVRDGEVFASSRDVAAAFGKQHRDVLRVIDDLLKVEPSLGLRSFAQTPFVEPQNGQTYRTFNMTRDGFTLLAMGFTGAKALKWKLRYIEAFNAMEAELRQRPARDPMEVLADPAAMRGLLLTYTEKVIVLQDRVAVLEPKAEALQRIAEADGSLCVTDAAKALQMRPSDLFRWLRENGWIYRRPGSGHDLGYAERTNAGDLEHKVTTVLRADGSEKVTEQVRVTPRGLAKLAKLVSTTAVLVKPPPQAPLFPAA